MKICLLGNSHAACLKKAWDELKTNQAYSTAEITFFASRAGGLRNLSLSNGVLVPQDENLKKDITFTSGGREAVVLSDYDVFLIIALGFTFPQIDKRLSSALVDILLAKSFERSVSRKVQTMVRQSTARPIFIGSTPLPTPGDRLQPGDYYHVNEVARLATRKYSQDGLVFLSQPEETVELNCFSKSEFTKNAPKLELMPGAINQISGDRNENHMNTSFGRIYLEQFFSVLGSI